jgi:hypothetical protein
MLQKVSSESVFSFADAGTDGWPEQVAALRWPCPYSEYDILGETFYRSLTDLPSQYANVAQGPGVFGTRNDRAAAMWLALGLAQATLAQTVRYAIEINHGAARGNDWRGSAADMPLLSWLRSDDQTIPIFLDRRWQRKRTTGASAYIRQGVKNATTVMQLEMPWLRQRARQVTSAPLFDANRDKTARASRSVSVSYSFLGLDTFAPEREMRKDVRELAVEWSRDISRGAGAFDTSVAKRIELLVDYVLSATISTAWRDMRQVQRRMPRRRLGERLISGTPTHAGRTLGWWCRKHDIPVERYAHGGDRGTHVDYGWDLVELPFCSRYVTHGALERDNFAARAATGAICRNFPEHPVFATFGSPKHQEIYRKTLNSKVPPGAVRRLLYVPGLYVTERVPLSPIFKTPDHLYAEWQLWFVKALKQQGYDVTIKLHPDGVEQGAAVFSHSGCRLIDGYLDPTHTNYGCLVFDFPGSAWFDCLAGHTAMVLIDLGARKLDTRSAELVRWRCPVVSAIQDDANRLRVNTAELDVAITAAQLKSRCDESSGRKFFWP